MHTLGQLFFVVTVPVHMASSFALPDTRRIRNFILRLPLATRIETAILTAFYIAHIVHPGLDQWGALVPQEIRLDTCMDSVIALVWC